MPSREVGLRGLPRRVRPVRRADVCRAVVSAEEAKFAVSHGCFVEGMRLERGGRVYVVRAARLEREAS